MTVLSGETFSLTYIIQHAQSAVSLQHTYTHTRSRKCSLINTPLSGIPAGLADPSPIWVEHLHNPFEREIRRLVRRYFISSEATGALCSGILNPANNLLPECLEVWIWIANAFIRRQTPREAEKDHRSVHRDICDRRGKMILGSAVGNQQRGLWCGCTVYRRFTVSMSSSAGLEISWSV